MTGKPLLAILAMSSLALGPADPLTYRFDEVKSKVKKLPSGEEAKETSVAAGDTAAGGDVVKTGFWARAVVSVAGKATRFVISSSTRVRLQGEEPGVLLVLEKGRLEAFFDALTGGPPVERKIAAPGALLAVRGTRFGLETGEGGETLLVVFEGTVELTPRVTGVPPVFIKANEFCTFGPRMAPPHPMPMRGSGMSEGAWGRRQMEQGTKPGEGGRPPGPQAAPGGDAARPQAPGVPPAGAPPGSAPQAPGPAGPGGQPPRRAE